MLAILGGWWLARDSGDSAPLKEPAVLAASCAPGGSCSDSTPRATRSPTPKPTRSPAPHPGSQAAPAISEGDAPPITGYSATVLEDGCGEALLELNSHVSVPPASLTKIMTALVAVDRTEPNDMVRIDVNGPELSVETDSTVMGIEPGMRLSMRDLLYGLLMRSGNDAAIQIAEEVSGSVPAFVRMMNEKADKLGLTDTHFTNPHGLDDAALYSSAYDMAVMGRALLQDPLLAEIVQTQFYQPAWDGPALENLNLLLGTYPGVLGIKTGYTDLAGQTIVAAAERGGRRIIVAVMGAQTEMYGDATGLLEWAFSETSACGSPRSGR